MIPQFAVYMNIPNLYLSRPPFKLLAKYKREIGDRYRTGETVNECMKLSSGMNR